MKYSSKNYAQALIDSLSGAGPADENQILDNFVKVLAENNDLRLFEQISEEFHKLELAKKGITQVEVTTAHPINRENEQEILDQLNRIAKGHYEVKKKVDESLIGGVIIRMEDQMIDASVKNNLEQLKDNLEK